MRELTTEELGRLLYKSSHEPRRNQKRYLKDLGGDGSAKELDEVLADAQQNDAATKEAERLERERPIAAATVSAGVEGQVAEMLAALRLRLDELDMTQTELGELCGWPRSQVSNYLNGDKSPGVDNLAKMAAALQSQWRLVSID